MLGQLVLLKLDGVLGGLTPEDNHEEAFCKLLICPVQTWLFSRELRLDDPTVDPSNYVPKYDVVEP